MGLDDGLTDSREKDLGQPSPAQFPVGTLVGGSALTELRDAQEREQIEELA